ncbi:MAG: hypothetical protein DWQ07_04825 [Chloroflexi bacterium]|nr:MAG: hypothetical protein DWQ07_04825 [Chloroflexota bacterium]MBL1194755.1 hypothetical protein [Chloroflexota bacterium]NOH12047.1 hypothetical protein [Chloroflexota bacterium]
MVFPLPPSDDVILREEVIYACGCTTTRIEHLRGQQASGSLCHGHEERVVKVIKTTEYPEAYLEKDNAPSSIQFQRAAK